MRNVYLDWASTTPPISDPGDELRVRREVFGNPSSIHSPGREAEKLLKQSRAIIADCCGCREDEVIFTSGATESNNLVVFSYLKKLLISPGSRSRKPRIITSAIEHASVWEPAKALEQMGFEIAAANPDPSGLITPDAVLGLLTENTVLVCVMLCNNETGVIEPLGEIIHGVRDYCRKHNQKIHVHTDAVQAFGKIWCSFKDSGVDSMSVSSHKLGGPRGTGALILKRNSILRQTGFFSYGGGQEQELRPGTENVAGIHGFAQAAKIRTANIHDNHRKALELMNVCREKLSGIPGLVFIPESRSPGKPTQARAQEFFSPYILSVSIPPIPAEVMVRSLDERGIAVSSGSACHTRDKKKRRRVLESMGYEKNIMDSAIRISTGPETTRQDIDALVKAMQETVPLLRQLSARMKSGGRQ